LRTRRYREHLQRGLSQFGSMLCWFLAVSVLSLGSATAIGFAAPLFTTLLSIVILKEKVGIHRWSALIVGFVGVLLITHPGAGTLTYGALFALGNAVLISTVAIAIRRMSMTESTETLTLYQMSIMTLCTAGLLTLGFRAPHWRDALIVALAGVGNGIAQLWWTRSLSLAPPSAVVRLTISRWYGQRFSASQCGGTCRPRACLSVPRSLSPRAFTSCGARPCAAARRSLRHSERSPTWRVAKSSADRDASLTLRWRNAASNPWSPLHGRRVRDHPCRLARIRIPA
jgi:uncharacterized membrane protein